MKTDIIEMLKSYKKFYRQMDENGGPPNNSELCDTIIQLEIDILKAMDLPPAQKFLQILWGDDIEAVVSKLIEAREEYRNRPIKDPALLLVNAILNKTDDPVNILPMAGFSLHTYQEFLFSDKLLSIDSPEDADEIIEEMRTAESRLDDLDKLEFRGVKRNMDLYHELIDLGLNHLDEYLMENDWFDLDDTDMNANQFCLRALIRLNRGKLDEAIADFAGATRLKPDVANIYYNRAIVYEMKGDTSAAMDDYSEAIRLDPGYMEALCNRGTILAQEGRYEEALDDFNRGVSLGTSSFHVYCNRGNLYAVLHKHEEAIDDFTKAIAMMPDEAYLYCNRGISYFQLDRKDRALEDLEKSAGMGFEMAKQFIRDFYPESRTGSVQ